MTPMAMSSTRRSTCAALALALGLALILGACLAPKRVEPLHDALRSYNEAVRWQRFDVAAARLPANERDDFLDIREEMAEELRVSDYRVVRVRHDKTGRRAKVQIKYIWHLDSRGVVRTTHTVQHWERPGKIWVLLSEYRLRGDLMPGVEDPEEPEEGDGDEAEAGGEDETAAAPVAGESPKRSETPVHALRNAPR